jgi:hypothetical protein
MLPLLVIFVSGALIQGQVRDAEDRNPLPLVNVYLEKTQFGTTTDEEGRYRLSELPPGRYELVFSMVGYEPEQRRVELALDDELRISVQLTPAPVEVPEVVTSTRRQEFKEEVKVSRYRMSAQEIGLAPGLLESDLMRALQALPGVVTPSDFSSALYVRGGSPDQNLIILDDAEVYNPFHLGGFFSTFPLETVDRAEFFAGGFPANYGNRLSSVLRIVSRTGDRDRFHGGLASSLLATTAHIESPLPYGSLLLSGRRTYYDQVLPLFGVQFPYYFYDYQAIAQFRPSARSELKYSGFGSLDRFDMAEEVRIYLDWLNRAHSLSYKHLFGDEGYLKLALARTDFEGKFEMGDATEIRNEVSQWALRGEAIWRVSSHRLSVGGEAESTKYNYDVAAVGLANYKIEGPGRYQAVWVQDHWNPHPFWIVEPGVRLEHHYAKYRLDADYLRVNPRLGIKYLLDAQTGLKLALGRFNQFLGITRPEQGMMPIYFWIPVFDTFPPQAADHLILGVERLFSEESDLQLETYYKRYPSLLIFNQYLDPLDIPSTVFFTAQGQACGLDLLYRYEAKKLQGWVSYSLGFSRFERNGRGYPTSFDRRHSLNILAGYRLGRGWIGNLRFCFGSGLPYTGVVGRYRYYYWDPITNDYRYCWAPVYGDYNSERYPPYHRLDVSITKDLQLSWGELDLSLQVINLYNNHNLFLYYYDYSTEPPQRRGVSMIPFLPSLELKLKF